MILPFPKLYLYAGMAVAVAGGAWWIYSRGKDAGKEQQKEESLTETKRTLEELRKNAEAEYQKVSTEALQAIEDAQKRIRDSERRESNLVATLSNLAQTRIQTQQQVASVPDNKLHDAVIQKLGIRTESENNTQSCFTPSEERAILTAVTDYPPCQKQTQLQSEQIAEVKQQVESLRAEVAGVSKQAEAERQLRINYGNFYTQLWNATRSKKRGLKCLGLWRCSMPKALPFPSPESLLAKPATP